MRESRKSCQNAMLLFVSKVIVIIHLIYFLFFLGRQRPAGGVVGVSHRNIWLQVETKALSLSAAFDLGCVT